MDRRSRDLRQLMALAALVGAFPCVIQGGAAIRLPAPTDVPVGPPGIQAPGGMALPEMTEQVAPGGPEISAIGDMTFADETLVITGHGLDGSWLGLWSEGRYEELRPQRVASDRIQARLPEDWPESTTLVWPIAERGIGRPIRINGATAWWCWPERIRKVDLGKLDLSLFGKNFSAGSRKPAFYLKCDSGGRWLEVSEVGCYRTTLRMPPDLSPGKYRVWAHNGSGGAHGWSEPLWVEITEMAVDATQRVTCVDDFGAMPDDGADDTAGVQAAIDDAIRAGGGTVRFSKGTYHISRTIELPEGDRGDMHLVGAGMGSYDAGGHAIREGSALRFLEGVSPSKCMLHIGRRFTSVEGMTLVGGHEGIVRSIHDRSAPSQVVVRIGAHDVRLHEVRVVMLDLRPVVPAAERKDLQIFDAALHLVARGPSQISVEDCEFHSAGSGIEIGTLQRGHTEDGAPDPSTDCVRIEGCIFRGYSPGFYKEPLQPATYGTMGIFNEGIQIPNGKRIVIRKCDFAGADRRGGKMIGRSICVYNTSVRELYISDNKSHDVGMVCPREDRAVNQGEQVLFHFRYPHGGYFDALEAGAADVSINPSDPRNSGKITSPHMASDRAGSRILDEVGTNDHWIVFISAGKGAGQYRAVTGITRLVDRVVLGVTPGWRVAPDRTSRITLTTAFRRNIISHNSIDAGFIDPRCKVSGILFWFNAFENIVYGNRLRHLGYGIGFNSSFRNPCGWNLVRCNSMERMGGMAVECNEPAFYFDSCRTAGGPDGPLYRKDSDVAGWYAVGNIARSNRGQEAASAAFVHAITTDAGSRGLPKEQAGGVMMPVLEHNTFTGVKRGVVINRGAIWPVIRNNKIETLDGGAAEIYDQGIERPK